MRTGTHVYGSSNTGSMITIAHNGDGLISLSPINASTGVRIVIENLGLEVDPTFVATNAGGGFVDVGGTFVTVRQCVIVRFAYGVIFDQTELGDILDCDFEDNRIGGVWLCNGEDHTRGALGGFTNRITIQRCQFNAGAIGVIDDGGAIHRLSDCNFNGNTQFGVRVAGAEPLLIEGNEFEIASDCILSTYKTHLLGNGVGQSALTIRSNFFATAGRSAPTGVADTTTEGNQVVFLTGSPVLLQGNLHSGPATAYAYRGVQNCATLNGVGNVSTGLIKLFDSFAANGTVFDALENGVMTVSNGRRRVPGSQSPASQNGHVGDIVENVKPTAGDYIGWIYTTAGQWSPYGLVA